MNSTSPPQPRFRGQALDSEQRQTFPRTISQDERELNFDTASAVDSCVDPEEDARPKSPSGSPQFALELPRPPSRSATGEQDFTFGGGRVKHLTEE